MPVDQFYLRDIRGLDPVSWWPPAVGWWVLAATVLLILAALAAVWVWRRRVWVRAQQRDARRRLRALRRRVGRGEAMDPAGTFSGLLRRVAMLRYGRAACAGLSGEAWLDWLSTHDPGGFDWRTEGRMLLEAPYAPGHLPVDVPQLQRLIDATLAWVEPVETAAPAVTAQPPAAATGEVARA